MYSQLSMVFTISGSLHTTPTVGEWMVKQHHYDVQEAIIKSTLEGEIHWSVTAHSVFWAECITILKSTGLSLYFMVHGVEPPISF